jgi:hypothetical protein
MRIIQYVAGHLKDDVMERIINRLIEIVRA